MVAGFALGMLYGVHTYSPLLFFSNFSASQHRLTLYVPVVHYVSNEESSVSCLSRRLWQCAEAIWPVFKSKQRRNNIDCEREDPRGLSRLGKDPSGSFLALSFSREESFRSFARAAVRSRKNQNANTNAQS